MSRILKEYLVNETNIKKTGTDAENFVAHELAKLGMWAGQFPTSN